MIMSMIRRVTQSNIQPNSYVIKVLVRSLLSLLLPCLLSLGLFSVAYADHGKSMTTEMDTDSSHKHAAKTQDIANLATLVITSGSINRIVKEQKQLIVKHEAIPEWNMKTMQMKFALATGISIDDFQVGQQIRFKLQQKNMMKFTIVEVLAGE